MDKHITSYKPPNPPVEHKTPVTRFERSADSAAMLFDPSDTMLRDLPPGGYVVFRADEPIQKRKLKGTK